MIRRSPFLSMAILPLLACMVAAQEEERSFSDATRALKDRAEASRIELSDLQSRIREEKVPLNNRLRTLQEELDTVEEEYKQILNAQDRRSLDISTLESQIAARKKQNDYVSNLLDEYLRNFETKLHVAEVQRHGERLDRNRRDAANANHTLEEKFAARLDSVALSIDRLEEAVGGTVFEGEVVNENGEHGEGTFVQFGPVAWFAGEKDGFTGLTDEQKNFIEPSVIPLAPELNAGIQEVAKTGKGRLPLDSTRGNARKIEEVQESVLDQIRKGGAVMYPLLTLAGVSLLVGFLKWIQLSRVQRMGAKRFNRMMVCVVNGQKDKAKDLARKVRGPIGGMLREGIDHADEPRDLLEEVLYEQVLGARSRLNSFIPFIKITAAASPLLGLLGTVSGMINTFKLITVFGTGDAQTFSSGISEALITTQWGLIVAIPSLLLAAFLSRKAKAVLDDMEKLSISFMNQLPESGSDDRQSPASPPRPPEGGGPGADPDAEGGDEDGLDLDFGVPQTT